jgi:hypothetical protein
VISSRNQAPIALFVYNRADCTRRTIEALARNIGAEKSDLVIFSDGPKSESDASRVAAVRSLLTGITGFRSIKIIESAVNRGLAASVIAGVTALTAMQTKSAR